MEITLPELTPSPQKKAVSPCPICRLIKPYCKCTPQLLKRCQHKARSPSRSHRGTRRGSPSFDDALASPSTRRAHINFSSPLQLSPQQHTPEAATPEHGSDEIGIGDTVDALRVMTIHGYERARVQRGVVQAFWGSRRKQSRKPQQLLVRFEDAPGGDWFESDHIRLVAKAGHSGPVEVLPEGVWRELKDFKHPGGVIFQPKGASGHTITDLVEGRVDPAHRSKKTGRRVDPAHRSKKTGRTPVHRPCRLAMATEPHRLACTCLPAVSSSAAALVPPSGADGWPWQPRKHRSSAMTMTLF